MPIYSKTHNYLEIDNGREGNAQTKTPCTNTSPAAVGSFEVRYLASSDGVRSLNNCLYTFGLYYKAMKKTGNITDLVGLACVLSARNGANRKIPARICADTGMGKRRNMGQHGGCPTIKNYRIAIGLPGEPVAPLRRSGAKLKANS